MNIKTILGFGLMGLASAFAQQAAPAAQPAAVPVQPAVAAEAPAQAQTAAPVAAPAAEAQPVQEATAPEVAAPEVAEAPVVEAPVAETAPEAAPAVEPAKAKEASAFDVLHGSAYNSVGNEAASDNVDSFLGRPDKFAGQKFFYVEPSAERGVVSFGSLFAALDISGSLGRATLGYAVEGFGIALKAGLGHRHSDEPQGETFMTTAGDDLGLIASKVLGGYAVVLNVDWHTYADEVGVEPEVGPSSDQRYRDLNIDLGLSNAPSGDKVFWSVGVNFERHLEETEVAGEIAFDSAASSMNFAPYFNIGMLGLESENARVYAGLNTRFPITMYDDRDVENEDGDKESLSAFKFEAFLSPNILGEYILNSNFMFFGEVAYDWLAFGYYKADEVNKDESSTMETSMDMVTADIGVRFQYRSLACEFALGDSFFTDTKSIFNGEGVFISFGAFLFF